MQVFSQHGLPSPSPQPAGQPGHLLPSPGGGGAGKQGPGAGEPGPDKNIHFTTFSEGFFMKGLAIFFRQDNVNQKYKTHPVKSYFIKQLLFISMQRKATI